METERETKGVQRWSYSMENAIVDSSVENDPHQSGANEHALDAGGWRCQDANADSRPMRAESFEGVAL
jgi:hypothetical protein